MTRALSFRTLELRMIVATVVGAVVGVWIAVAGGGAWAIIAQALATTATSTALLWVASDWRPRAMFSWERLRDLGSSGLRMFGTQITFFLNKNTDNVLIGRMLGPAALGVYAIAFNLMLFPITRIAGPIRSVLFPALSRVQQDRARLIRGWLTGSRVIAAVAAPAMLGMVAVAPDFVPVVLGDQWREAVPVLQILALVGLLQAMQIVGGSALNAVGAFGTTLRFTIASYLLNVVAFLAGMPWGIEGVAVAYAISTAVMFPVFIALTAGHIGARAGDYARAVGDVLACAAAMGAAVALARWGLVAAGAGAGLRLAGLVAVGAAVYTALILLLCPGLVREMRDLRGRRTRPAADAVSGG